MKFEVSITKIRFFAILGAILVLAGAIAIYAYGSNPANPAVFGHTANEIEGVCKTDGTGCPAGLGGGGFTNMVVFTSSGSWAVPNGVTKAKITIIGGGGGGGGGTSGFGAGPGGGGGGFVQKIVTLDGISSLTIVVGVGGSGGTSTTQPTNGGYSSIVIGDTTLSVGGGAAADNNHNGGAGGSASGGTINIAGQTGGHTAEYTSGAGGSAALYSMGGSSVTASSRKLVIGGISGKGYGAGGSGGSSTSIQGGQGSVANGGAGSSGAVIIEY